MQLIARLFFFGGGGGWSFDHAFRRWVRLFEIAVT